MKPPERAHAFQTNKVALSIPRIDRHTMLDTLGAQLNLSAIVDGILGGWTLHFQRNWCNFAHLTILLFHSDTGTQMNDTSDANDLAVLLPVVNGPLENCCKQVCFIRVQLNLNFTSLVPRGVQGSRTHDPPGRVLHQVAAERTRHDEWQQAAVSPHHLAWRC